MDVELVSPSSGRSGRLVREAESSGWQIALLGAIGLVALAFGWFIVEAPAIESFALAVGVAVAWSMWLDRGVEETVGAALPGNRRV